MSTQIADHGYYMYAMSFSEMIATVNEAVPSSVELTVNEGVMNTLTN